MGTDDKYSMEMACRENCPGIARYIFLCGCNNIFQDKVTYPHKGEQDYFYRLFGIIAWLDDRSNRERDDFDFLFHLLGKNYPEFTEDDEETYNFLKHLINIEHKKGIEMVISYGNTNFYHLLKDKEIFCLAHMYRNFRPSIKKYLHTGKK